MLTTKAVVLTQATAQITLAKTQDLTEVQTLQKTVDNPCF